MPLHEMPISNEKQDAFLLKISILEQAKTFPRITFYALALLNEFGVFFLFFVPYYQITSSVHIIFKRNCPTIFQVCDK